ncbi:helix-turn-helix domain-containing protein [Pseudomonas cavernae]|uniref:Helix-turn-helix domain-containing protein n=1 Tax=Pseudomonas cavernae TaxID=2320867 RepID=A0A385Z9W0_9PSED|nr:helix-turn-helix domain-containing protein [Pseudomonas cavernae]AYC35107.1 helix-turn-helix domain-containing protein [Pseudomonas cavernae]
MQIQAHKALDVDQQQRVIAGWEQHYQQMSPGAFRGQIVHLELGGVAVYEERMNTRVEQYFHAPASSLVFSFDAVDGSLYLLNGESQNTWITPENYKEVAVVLDQNYLSRLAGLDLSVLDGLFLTPLRSQHSRLFGRWLSGTLGRLLATPDQLAEENLARQLVDDCLFVLECSTRTLDDSGLRRLARDRQVVRKVFELATAFPDEHFNVLQLASVASVSVRQLQKSFTAFIGVAPNHWLRLRRLNAAHRDLLRASPGETTVAEIAMRWSFWHLGRFSEAYRQLFNELPSCTLLRRS